MDIETKDLAVEVWHYIIEWQDGTRMYFKNHTAVINYLEEELRSCADDITIKQFRFFN